MTLSKNGKDIIADIPIDRLLTESDGPFVTNEGNVCSPLDIGTTIENLSRLKNIDPIELKSIVYSNLKRILSHNQDTKVH
jgi:TatD DNase family protein